MDEIHRLVGGQDSISIQTAIRRLSNAGLLEWSERQIRIPAPSWNCGDDRDAELQRMVELVTNHRRKVPVPRRTLRFLARISQPVTIATVLGHLLRCLFYRNGMCQPVGRCKASWVADVFGVDVRNVKAARRHLGDIGWLVVEHSPQTAMNRWGAMVTLQLKWRFGDARHPVKMPPPPLKSDAESPPPREYWKLSSRTEDQKPAQSVRIGACAPPMPILRNVRLEDLHNPHRLDVLLEEAQRRHLVPAGEAARLRFHAAAAHAVRLGKRNPPGLFASIVVRGLWSFLGGIDEDLAGRQLANLASKRPLATHCRDKDCSLRSAVPTQTRVILESVLAKLRTATAGIT
ncbi:MAG: hypothetical protein GDA67_16745 [Nitrospira sp. CR1.3]|nr:hypothetical protein [Nitrospira sp. CR1.3]